MTTDSYENPVKTRKPVSATRILLAISNEVDRVVLESDLLRVGYKIGTAQDVSEALTSARLADYDALVVEVGLSGGGGFSLGRKLGAEGGGLPTVALSVRAVDLEVRRMGEAAGVDTFVEAPFHLGQIEAAVELVVSRDRVRDNRHLGHTFSGHLAEWTVADLARYMSFYKFTGFVSVSRPAAKGILAFRDGTLTSAELEETFGERAVSAMLDWNDGLFTLTAEAHEGPEMATVRPPRNVHRSIGDLLVDALANQAEGHRHLSDVPGLDERHDFDLEKARHVTRDTNLLGRMRNAFESSRTLREVLHLARVEGAHDVSQVLALLRAGAIVAHDPVRDSLLEPIEPALVIADNMRPAIASQPAMATLSPVTDMTETMRKGATVSRKLGFKLKHHGDGDGDGDGAHSRPAFEESESDRLQRRRTQDRTRMTWMSVAAVITVILVSWFALRENDSKVPEVRVLDDAAQTSGTTD
ncbi:MAG: DNA-binding response OmpR family regulator [Myxococcota bacterium]